METFFVKRQGAGEPDIFEEEITMSFKEVAVGVSVDDSATKQRPFPIGRDVDAIQVLIHPRVQYLVLGLITIRIQVVLDLNQDLPRIVPPISRV